MINRIKRRWADLDVSGLIFPRLCIGCSSILNRNETLICLVCEHQLPLTGQWLGPSASSKLFRGRVNVSSTISYVFYSKGDILQKMMIELKYNGRKDVGTGLGELFGRVLNAHNTFAGVDGMVAVPLHPAKKERRGYNQSEMIIKGIQEHLEIPDVSQVLERTQFTPSQTRKNRFQRFRNMDRVFICNQKQSVENKHLLLVDDVITTGSTMEACAQTLLSAGADKVSVATIACA